MSLKKLMKLNINIGGETMITKKNTFFFCFGIYPSLTMGLAVDRHRKVMPTWVMSLIGQRDLTERFDIDFSPVMLHFTFKVKFSNLLLQQDNGTHCWVMRNPTEVNDVFITAFD